MKNFIKGLVIGVGKIMPGISGSMLAISLGVYKKLLYCLADFFKLTKQDYKFLIEICCGIFISIYVLSNLIILIMNKYMIFIISIFLGFIIGDAKKSISHIKFKKNDLFYMLFPFIIIIILNSINIQLIISPVSLVLIGILEAFTMIIPGISGTALFLYLGIYEEILKIISNLNELHLLLPFSLGVSTGILIFAKLISKFIEQNEQKFKLFATGFSIATSFILFKNMILINLFDINFLFCIFLFIGSFLLSFYFIK